MVVGVCCSIVVSSNSIYVRYIYNIDEDLIGVRDWASFVEDNASFLEKIDNSKSDESIIEE